VSKVLKFAALYPNHLNLNGDHANLLILKKRLEWRGVPVEIIEVFEPIDFETFDLVLLGHGSPAAWDDIENIDSSLVSNLVNLINTNVPVLAVSSGYVKLMEFLGSDELSHGQHVSQFANFDGVVGYLNTDVQLPEITWLGNSMLTMFHGPVLAKNPKLADEIIEKAQWCDITLSSSELVNADILAEASRRIAFED